MTKEEFFKKSPYEQFSLMKTIAKKNIGANEKENQSYIKTLTGWMKETLEKKCGIIDIPKYGLVKLEDAQKMGLNLDIGAIETVPLEKNEKKWKWHCPKMEKYREGKKAEEARLRQYNELNEPMGGEKNEAKLSF